MSETKNQLLKSLLVLVLCIAMLTGSTFAWFTDSAVSSGNIITAGNLDVEMYWTDNLDDPNSWRNVEDSSNTAMFSDEEKWEPGYTSVRYIKIVNNGSLALNYDLILEAEGRVGKLAEVINVYASENINANLTDRSQLGGFTSLGLLENVMNGGTAASGTLLAADQQNPSYNSGETIVTLALSMLTTAGNEYKGESIGDGFKIKALATQCGYESDSFGDDYDGTAEMPESIQFTEVTVPLENGAIPAGGLTMNGVNGVSAYIPEGVALEADVTKLTLTISPLEETTSDITVVNSEVLIPVDVHIEGVADGNTAPIIIDLGPVMPKYLNFGNYKLVHVEDGVNNYMECVADRAALNDHNDFAYDPATGNLSVAMASFSEVAVVADMENAWAGNYDYSWYDANATELSIANADQLAAFSAIVGGMNGQTKDSFDCKTVRLLADINLGDKEGENDTDKIFYPIGYYNSTGSYPRSEGTVTSNVSSFEGTFDGNGHTISNFYQNTWEMFGDYNDGYSGTPNYYKDAMGLFGYVYGGTIKNLTVSNFSSDGEFTPTGVIAAYAVNSTFENIAITNCNPRVYNTGNGGIIGIAGNSNDQDTKITLKNITVDNSNKISALWGSWDVACGGLVGMFRGNADGGTGEISFENCHVAAQIDVYNDVCANYQYYAYRYAGMIIGSVRHNTTNEDGKTLPNMKGISASGCTVNYGTWNDYYYCEFEENTMASYSEDYQFSRVPNSEIDTTNGKENATCIGHNHTKAEDKQAVYLPFNQLFTGYGWGVNSVGLKEYSGIYIEGVSEGDQEESIDKFTTKLTADSVIMERTQILVGELFAAIDGVKINDSAVQVAVSALDSNAITAEYVADTSNWKNGTLTFNKVKGLCSVTIQDYNFCKPTTVILKDGKVHSVFESKFTGDFLYRVGNGNEVTLGTLFAENDVTIYDSAVKVKIESEYESNASGEFTANTSNWEEGTIQFTNTGVVKVAIQDETYCNITELYLEVVNATNVAENGKIGNYNTTSVLLGNTTVSSLYLNSGATLYGNGFTVDCTNAPINGTGSVSENYVIALVGAHLDNVKVVGKVYTEYGAQASNDYNRALVVTKGNSTITNCYLSNTASPIRLVEGSLEVKGTTVKGGNFANIDVRNGQLAVEDVTTINQALGNDKADDGSTVIGLGIVVYYENVDTAVTSVIINGTLTQYNHISSNDKFSHEYATQLVNAMLGEGYEAYQTTVDGVKWVNPGIVAMTHIVPADNRSDKAGYVGMDVRFAAQDGHVYAVQPTSESITETPADYATIGQGLIAPTYSFDYTTKNYVAKTDGSNDYCYYDNGKISIAMDQGDTFEWDPFILTATKSGETLGYTVSMNGTTYASGSKIAFSTSGDYKVIYTYTDGNNYTVNADGNLVSVEVTYEKTANISVSVIQPSAQYATFTFADTNTVTEKVTVNDKTYISATGVSATDKEWGYITVNDTKIFYPITEAQMKTSSTLFSGNETQVYYYVFKDAVTITDYKDGGTGAAQIYDSTTTTMPSNLTVVNGMEAKYTDISSACVDMSKLTKDGPSGEVWDFSASTTVSGTTTYNDYLAHSSPSGLSVKSGTRDYDAITVAQFSYTDAAGATYYYFVGYFMPNQVSSSSSGGGGCVAPDTLVTLADGSQKEIQHVTYENQLMVWDFVKGKYTSAPSSIVMNHGYDNYDVVTLNFEDGTVVKTINGHGFYDEDLNKFVIIGKNNVADFVGHKFIKQDGSVTELSDYSIHAEYTESWSVLTAEHYNCMLEGMLTVTPAEVEGSPDYLMPYTVGEDMMYDAEAMQADIEKYGLYTYEEFADLLTPEQFYGLGLQNFKVAVGKGYITYDEILFLIDLHMN